MSGSRDTFWTTQRRAYLQFWGGKKTDQQLAMELGCAAITVRKARSDMGIEGYRGRPHWDRRQWLLNSASGLDFCVSLCRV